MLELLKLGIDVGQTTVAKYMAKRRKPPSQGWKTFLRDAIEREIEATFDDHPGARSEPDQATRIFQLKAEILAAEHVEEPLIERAERDGVAVARRADCDVRAVLGVAIGMAARANAA